MKRILFLALLLVSGFAFADNAKLSMDADSWAAYKDAREAKDWAKCEELTVFPDVKAWDANNQGQEKFVAEDYLGAKADFERALKHADKADEVGRSKGMEKLRKMVNKALRAIEKNL